METLEFKLKCGCIKKGESWKIENPKANIVIFEGMEEHLARYDKFAQYLNKKGFSVYGLDTFGQGKNVAEDLSNIGVWPEDGFAKQLSHNDQLIVHLNETTKVPTYIFAHSMGSFYAQAYLEEYGEHVQKIVLCGSGTKSGILGLGHLIAKMVVNKKNEQEKAKLLNNLMFGNFNKAIKNPRTTYDWLSVDETNVDRYIADPLCGFGPRNRFCLEFIKGMVNIYKGKNLQKVRKDIPLFFISGDGDPVTGYGKFVEDNKKLFSKYGVKDIDTKVYKGLRHEILNEKEWETVAEDVSNFFLK